MKGFADSGIVITGGAGFVGSNLARHLLTQDVRSITIVDNLLSSEQSNIPEDPRISFIEGSAADDETLKRLPASCDYVFHLSTFHGNQNSIYNPLADHENNLLPTLKLFIRLGVLSGVKKVVYASAGCVVAKKGVAEAEATDEEAPLFLEQDSPYAISKVVGEYYSVYFHSRHCLPVVRARFQNVYGPGEILGAGQWRGTTASVWRNVIPVFVYKAFHGQSLAIDGDGSATRDFIFVEDIVHGLERCALQGAAGDVYNLASGIESSILTLAQTINSLTGNDAPLRFAPGRPWDHSTKRFGSAEKAKKDLGFVALVSLDDGLRRTIEWTRQNLPFIEACIERHRAQLENARSD